MNRRQFFTLAAATALAIALPACAHSPPPLPGSWVAVEVYDRIDRTSLPVYEKDGRRYVVGTPGHEYALRIRNVSGRRVLAVTSVDGVNVITGETASPEQSGYVLEPWGSVEIAGWRKDLARTAAFYFTDLGDSYAARTGRPFDVGVIGVAAFPERVPAIARQRVMPYASEKGPASPRAEAHRDAPAAPPAEQAAGSSMTDSVGRLAQAPAPAAKLGTGHGREETSYVQQVRFERESSTPAQVVAIQYDRRENLAAMGVLPPSPPIAYRTPSPFPAMRFVPDPPR